MTWLFFFRNKKRFLNNQNIISVIGNLKIRSAAKAAYIETYIRIAFCSPPAKFFSAVKILKQTTSIFFFTVINQPNNRRWDKREKFDHLKMLLRTATQKYIHVFTVLSSPKINVFNWLIISELNWRQQKATRIFSPRTTGTSEINFNACFV